MARIKNPDRYLKKFKSDFDIVNSSLLDEDECNNLIACVIQLENSMEDEIRGIIKEKEKIKG